MHSHPSNARVAVIIEPGDLPAAGQPDRKILLLLLIASPGTYHYGHWVWSNPSTEARKLPSSLT
jgi:hypothetical protein